MSAFEIESGVPVPGPGSGKPRYPWPAMRPGDSIIVPSLNDISARTAAAAWCKRNLPDCTVTMRRLGDGTTRIWMVAKARNEGVHEDARENVG